MRFYCSIQSCNLGSNEEIIFCVWCENVADICNWIYKVNIHFSAVCMLLAWIFFLSANYSETELIFLVLIESIYYQEADHW